MELHVIRYSTSDESTLGLLYINSEFACYSLEDTYNPVKIYGKTRIPAGRYQIKFRKEGRIHTNYSAKFGDFHKGMLHITNVPNYEFILIHIGNKDDDTEGCLLVGDKANNNKNADGFIESSTNAYKRIYPQIAAALEAGEEVWINYTDTIPFDFLSMNTNNRQTVNTDQLNFRSAPNGYRKGILNKGTEVNILKKENKWSIVIIKGWVANDYLS